ncbi:MAG: hypothetical protein ACRDH6_08135 [Actinomycetota bacterium]
MTPGARAREEGGALLEVALFLPLVVFMAAAAAFIVGLLLDYSTLNRLSETGARYATRAGPDPSRVGEYRLRPSAAEVEAYVRGIADLPLETVSVTPDPQAALPGDDVTVTVATRVELGPLGRAVNGLVGAFTGLFGEGPPLPPEGFLLESTTVMREE